MVATGARTLTPTRLDTMPLSVMLIGLALLGAASAARPEPNTAASLEGRVSFNPLAQMGVAEPSPVVESPSAIAGFRLSPGVLQATTPACAAAFSALNNDTAYTQAINAVYDDARAMEPEAAKECEKHLNPSYDPFGGWCKAEGWLRTRTRHRHDYSTLQGGCPCRQADSVRGGVQYFRPLYSEKRVLVPTRFHRFSVHSTSVESLFSVALVQGRVHAVLDPLPAHPPARAQKGRRQGKPVQVDPVLTPG
jgi:hypothetical protein